MTVMDRDSCEHLGFLATPEKIADAYKATGIPAAPDVRRCEDELAPIPEGRKAFENTTLACAAVAVLALIFIP